MPTAAEHISHMAYGATDRQSAEASTSNASRQARNDVAAEDVRWVTQDELTDLRAMQRTFDLAYLRTALSELSFGVLVIKLFESRFQIIGLVYALLCAGIAATALWRTQLAVRNSSKVTVLKIAPAVQNSTHAQQGPEEDDHDDHDDSPVSLAQPPQPPETEPLLRRYQSGSAVTRVSAHSAASTASQHVLVSDTFRTAGDVILVLVLMTVLLQVMILGFLLDL